MYFRGRVAVCIAVAVSCAVVAADPLPTELRNSGGRIVPDRSVPVDIVSESLVVQMAPIPERGEKGLRYGLCRADVTAEYVLESDEKLHVPVTSEFPCFMMGSGYGMWPVTIDYDIQTTCDKVFDEYKLKDIRFGDIVYLRDQLNWWGRGTTRAR